MPEPTGRTAAETVLRVREYSIGGALVLLILVTWLANPSFLDQQGIKDLLLNSSILVLLATGQSVVVLTRNIDLSVASMLGLSSALAGALWDAGWTFETIVPVCLVVGLLGGLLNGWLVTRVGLPSLAVTIGTLTLYRGLASVVLGNKAVADFPETYARWASNTETVPGTFVPYPLALFAVLAACAALVLHRTGFGRALFAVGAQEDAAYFAGVRVKRLKLILFAVSGFVASFAGIVYTLRYGSARADNGLGLELTVVAAVLLGGIDFDGGRGTLGGAVAGVLLIGVLNNLLTLNDVSHEIQVIVTGALLIVSVLTPRAIAVLTARKHRRTAITEATDTALGKAP
ncbi:ABC transporter permease [Streptomyces sp. A73]|nr:ABC transporter permease [Streptomyces sp. A73]